MPRTITNAQVEEVVVRTWRRRTRAPLMVQAGAGQADGDLVGQRIRPARKVPVQLPAVRRQPVPSSASGSTSASVTAILNATATACVSNSCGRDLKIGNLAGWRIRHRARTLSL